MFSKEVIFLSPRTEGKQTGTLCAVISRREGEKGREKGGVTKDGKLNCRSSPNLYLSIVTEVGKPYPLSLFSFHPPFPCLPSLSYQEPRTTNSSSASRSLNIRFFVATKKAAPQFCANLHAQG